MAVECWSVVRAGASERERGEVGAGWGLDEAEEEDDVEHLRPARPDKGRAGCAEPGHSIAGGGGPALSRRVRRLDDSPREEGGGRVSPWRALQQPRLPTAGVHARAPSARAERACVLQRAEPVAAGEESKSASRTCRGERSRGRLACGEAGRCEAIEALCRGAVRSVRRPLQVAQPAPARSLTTSSTHHCALQSCRTCGGGRPTWARARTSLELPPSSAAHLDSAAAPPPRRRAQAHGFRLRPRLGSAVRAPCAARSATRTRRRPPARSSAASPPSSCASCAPLGP